MTFIRELESKTSEELLSDYRHSKDHMINSNPCYVPMVSRKHEHEKYTRIRSDRRHIEQKLIALMKSIDKYDPEKNVKFDTYINKRIKGLIIDMARKPGLGSTKHQKVSKRSTN